METKLIDEQKTRFQEALKKKYTACLFDIDGTLTERGDEFIPEFLQKKLGQMAEHIPMGVCTARKFDHALARVSPIFQHASEPLRAQANWVMICENGCLGYFFNPQTLEYEEFYRVSYPYDAAHFQSLFNHLKNLLGPQLQTCFTCEVTMIFRPVRVDDSDREALAARSLELARIIQQELLKFDPKGVLKIGNSGIGVTLFPADGNKERGILEFAKYLQKKTGRPLSDQAREIIAVGDQPIPPGNDVTFLNGEYGTPFTVGACHPTHLLPLPVFSTVVSPLHGQAETLQGPKGTLSLLEQLKFTS